jgi:hypothetical protein
MVSDVDAFSVLNLTTAGNITTMTRGVAIHGPIRVAWNEDELSIFPTAYASSLAQMIGVPLPSTIAPGQSSSLPTPTSSSSTSPTAPRTDKAALSKRAIASIAVGSAIAAVLLGFSIFLIISRRRRGKRAHTAAEKDELDMPEMGDQEQSSKRGRWLNGGRWRNEVLTEGGELEVTAERERQELPVEERQQELESGSVFVVPGSPAELPVPEMRLGATNEEERRSMELRGS